MATNVKIKQVNGQKILNLYSILFGGKYYRQVQIGGNMYGVKMPDYLKSEYPFEGLNEFYIEGMGGDKNENNFVLISLRLNSAIQNEIRKCFGGTVDGINWAKNPSFDSYKNDKSCYSFSVFINNTDAYPTNYEQADFSIALGNLISSSSETIERINVEGQFSSKLNEEFARFTVTPALMIDKCHFWDGGKLQTMTIRMNTEYKSGSYTTDQNSDYGCSGRGRGTIRVYNNSGSLLNEFYLDNDNFSVGSTPPRLYGISVDINGSNRCYYAYNNYRVEFDLEYWNSNTGAYLEY